jgi:PIN domain nuclease of toxin-antitoxin system
LCALAFRHWAVTLSHAQRAGALDHPHRDPFDRMLVAQALAEDLSLISNEAMFDGFAVKRLW